MEKDALHCYSQIPSPDDPIFALPEQWQRDFVWSMLGPALVDCSWAPHQHSAFNIDPEWVFRKAAEPEPEFLSKGSRRLGHYFERLWEVYFRDHGERFRGGQQIYEGGRTLGELDALLEVNGQDFHVELAVKFYLQFGVNWYGPQAHDRLDLKLAHLQAHQLKLSEHPTAVEQLKTLHWQPKESFAILRGCLFYAPKDYEQSQSLGCSQFLKKPHWNGSWCYQTDWQKFLTHNQWQVLPKPRWLSPCLSPTVFDLNQIAEKIDEHFKTTDFPICLTEMHEGPNGFAEQHRWLVVSETWPENRSS